jgi:hypothetical protein
MRGTARGVAAVVATAAAPAALFVAEELRRRETILAKSLSSGSA